MSSRSVLFDAPGPRTRRRMLLVNIVSVVVVLGILAWVLWALWEKGQLTPARWEPFLDSHVWVSYLLPGLRDTLIAAGIAMVLANVFGLIFGLGRLSQVWLIRAISGVVVEFFRAVPVLILMIFFWYFLSFNGIVAGDRSPLFAVVIGLTLYNGSVIAELVRSGVGSLPGGQREAGLAVGLTISQTLRSIQLPQALIAMMPSMVAQLVVILKDTALGYLVTYPELLRQARLAGVANGNLIPTLIVVAVIFILVNYSLGLAAEKLSARLGSRTSGSAAVADADIAEGDAGMESAQHAEGPAKT